jgi:hypothetical protein
MVRTRCTSDSGWSASGVLLGLLALGAALALFTGGCGGGGRAEEAASVTESVPPPLLEGGAVEEALALLPASEALRRQILFGDLERLRAAHPEASDYGLALSGVWLPDALVGANGPLWRKAYGFGLGPVDRFVAGGFHPEEVTVAVGRFEPERTKARLRKNGYKARGGLLRRGADGSIDTETPVGRLALSALNRVAVEPERLVAASTTALAKAAFSPVSTFAEDESVALAARVLGDVTSAVILPAELVRPPSGVPVEYLAAAPAELVAAGLDDGGPADRLVKIVLVYGLAAEAAADAQTFEARIAAAPLVTQERSTFGDLLEDIAVQVLGERAVAITGRLAPGEQPGAWRGLLERGDLAVLVRPA